MPRKNNSTSAAKRISVDIHMYRLKELGDCFLLTFNKDKTQSHVLIDCGSFRNSKTSIDRLKKIVGDIKQKVSAEGLEVVIGTHQHNDHLSGFLHCQKDFEDMNIRQVWLSWLDNPKDSVARKVRESQKNFSDTLNLIGKKLGDPKSSVKDDEMQMQIKDVLGFYHGDSALLGAAGPPVVPEEATKFLKRLGQEPVNYLQPGQIVGLPGLEKEVRIFVLGPPKNTSLLFDIHPTREETFDPKLAAAQVQAEKFLDALNNQEADIDRVERHFPFNDTFKRIIPQGDQKDQRKNVLSENLKVIMNIYEQQDTWRRIDGEWLQQAGRLALFLDSYTNNSSLVLAIELIKSGKVLLFVGDAQTGNWLSWKDIKWNTEEIDKDFKTFDLLHNTVLYKVGHHASHNATLVEGLEAMTREDLIAMIPVHKDDPNITKENGWKMPAQNLYRNLKQKTNKRVLRMDDGYADQCDPSKDAEVKKNWSDSGAEIDISELIVKCTIMG